MGIRRLFVGALLNFDLAVSGLSLAALVFLTALGVVMRFIVNSPLAWLEEMQLLLFVWVAFFGAGVAFRHGGHIAIDVLVDLFPPRLRLAVAAADSLLVAVILALVMHWEFSRGLTLTRTGRATSILGIPTALHYFGVAAACLSMLCHFLRERTGAFLAWRRARAAGRGDGHA